MFFLGFEAICMGVSISTTAKQHQKERDLKIKTQWLLSCYSDNSVYSYSILGKLNGYISILCKLNGYTSILCKLNGYISILCKLNDYISILC